MSAPFSPRSAPLHPTSTPDSCSGDTGLQGSPLGATIQDTLYVRSGEKKSDFFLNFQKTRSEDNEPMRQKSSPGNNKKSKNLCLPKTKKNSKWVTSPSPAATSTKVPRMPRATPGQHVCGFGTISNGGGSRERRAKNGDLDLSKKIR